MRRTALLLLLLAACTVDGQSPEPTLIPAEGPAAQPVAAQPLRTTLDVPPRGEFPFNKSASCNAAGGTAPYRYRWRVDGVASPCAAERCRFVLETGAHALRCGVTDSDGTVASDTASVMVERRRVGIDVVAVFGDSLSYGEGLGDPATGAWPALLAASFGDAELANYAVSDATSREVLAQVRGRAPITGEALVFVWVGANDAKYLVPREVFAANLRAAVEALDAEGRVVLLTVPDASKLSVAGDVEAGVNDFLGQFGVAVDVKGVTQDVIRSYNAVIGALGEEYGLAVIDMFTYLGAFDSNLIAADRFHPNEAGHVLIEERVRSALEATYPDEAFV